MCHSAQITAPTSTGRGTPASISRVLTDAGDPADTPLPGRPRRRRAAGTSRPSPADRHTLQEHLPTPPT